MKSALLSLVSLLFALLPVAAIAEPEQRTEPESPSLEIVDGNDGVFHVRVLMRVYQGDEEFDLLALHGRNENGDSMEVGVIVEEYSDNMLEAWLHVVGVDELKKYSFHVFYSAPCADELSEDRCRKEYVLEPVISIDDE